jgi:hypothetical protein
VPDRDRPVRERPRADRRSADNAERNVVGDYLITVSSWLARKLLNLILPE